MSVGWDKWKGKRVYMYLELRKKTDISLNGGHFLSREINLELAI